MKPCFIKQPAGVGDVFFLQKIAHTYRDSGHEIIWPLKDHIFWISEYISDITWLKLSDWMIDSRSQIFNYAGFSDNEKFVYIDCSTADRTFNTDPTRIMSSKYGMVGINYKDWGKYFKFNRNKDKENELYYDILGLNDDSKYSYINDIVHTDMRDTGKLSGKEFNYPIIKNQIIDGFSLFDWIKVFENAKEIHTIPTAVCFIVDVIDTKAKVFYYPNDERQYKDIIDIFSNVTEYRNA